VQVHHDLLAEHQAVTGGELHDRLPRHASERVGDIVATRGPVRRARSPFLQDHEAPRVPLIGRGEDLERVADPALAPLPAAARDREGAIVANIHDYPRTDMADTCTRPRGARASITTTPPARGTTPSAGAGEPCSRACARH
jgi:hypothetical protein